MLERLQRRLFVVSVSVLMLLITALLSLSLWNSVNIQRENDIVNLQRMTFLLINQLQDNMEAAPEILADYEHEMGIYSRLITSNNRILYESNAVDIKTLQKTVENTMAVNPAPTPSSNTTQPTSSQSGIIQCADDTQRYNLAPATIVDPNGAIYQLTLAMPESNLYTLLRPELPRATLLWVLACSIIIITSRLLLRRAFTPAEEMNARQKNFIAAASHELKSPLAVIMANAELLQAEPLPATARKRLSVIDSECTRMAHLTSNLLFLTAADTNRTHLNHSPVDIENLLITLYDAYVPLCSQYNKTLHLDLPEAALPTPQSDADRIRQVLTIFLDNAISHTPPGTTICLRANVTQKNLHLLVNDNGPGIATCDVPHLFERFYRADHAHSDKQHTGLGLAIAQTLASQLGSTVSYTPSAEGGACFTLSLPL